ncbi:MAG: hypothetical protein JWQ78_1625 [Sediminibacterium sp.]|nr:hypothetical protein [Sediminibacterium sp.]
MGTILLFYRSYALFSLVITFFCATAFYRFGFAAFTAIFWLKIASYGLSYYVVSGYKQNEFYYYRNLGFSIRFLWVVTILIDLTLFIAVLIKTYSFQ